MCLTLCEEKQDKDIFDCKIDEVEEKDKITGSV